MRCWPISLSNVQKYNKRSHLCKSKAHMRWTIWLFERWRWSGRELPQGEWHFRFISQLLFSNLKTKSWHFHGNAKCYWLFVGEKMWKKHQVRTNLCDDTRWQECVCLQNWLSVAWKRTQVRMLLNWIEFICLKCVFFYFIQLLGYRWVSVYNWPGLFAKMHQYNWKFSM